MNKLSDALIISSFCTAGAFAAMEFDNHIQDDVVPRKIDCYESAPSNTADCIAAVDESYSAQYIGIQVLELAGIGGALYGGYAAIRIARNKSQHQL